MDRVRQGLHKSNRGGGQRPEQSKRIVPSHHQNVGFDSCKRSWQSRAESSSNGWGLSCWRGCLACAGHAQGASVHASLRKEGPLQGPDGPHSSSRDYRPRCIGRSRKLRTGDLQAQIWGGGMNKTLPVTDLARHGETAWTITVQRAGCCPGSRKRKYFANKEVTG